MSTILKLKVTLMKGGSRDPINRYRFENIKKQLNVEVVAGNEFDINLILGRKLYRNILRVIRNKIRGTKTILDITDDLFLDRYQESWLKRLKRTLITHNAVKWFVAHCDVVVCSSTELRDRYMQYSDAVYHIDDAIDVVDIVKEQYDRPIPRIVWVGTSHNMYHLLPIEGVLFRLQQEYGVEIVLISRENASENLIAYLGRDLRFKYTLDEWSLDTYIQKIMKNDIAIAPIANDARSAAKSSNKLITYMYHGMPVVASGLREYMEHIVHGENGFLANSVEDWYKHLQLLVTEPKKREQVGMAARKYARTTFSIPSIASQWNDIIRILEDKKLSKSDVS